MPSCRRWNTARGRRAEPAATRSSSSARTGGGSRRWSAATRNSRRTIRRNAGRVRRHLGAQAVGDRSPRESEEQLRSMAEKSPSMIFINQGGRIVYVNPQCSLTRRATRPRSSCPKHSISRAWWRQNRCPWSARPLAVTLRGEDVPAYEYDLLTRLGVRLTVINATKLINYRGQPAVLGSVADISERKRAEQEVRRERDFSDAVLNSLPGIFYMFDPLGKLVRWNRQAETILRSTRRTRFPRGRRRISSGPTTAQMCRTPSLPSSPREVLRGRPRSRLGTAGRSPPI